MSPRIPSLAVQREAKRSTTRVHSVLGLDDLRDALDAGDVDLARARGRTARAHRARRGTGDQGTGEGGGVSMKVGDKVWLFDENRRVYAKDDHGNSTGGPIWREHWREATVIGENRVVFFASWWATTFSEKRKHEYTRISKADLRSGKKLRNVALSLDEIERQAWAHEHRWDLSERVRRVTDYDTLVAVAKLIAPELAP